MPPARPTTTTTPQLSVDLRDDVVVRVLVGDEALVGSTHPNHDAATRHAADLERRLAGVVNFTEPQLRVVEQALVEYGAGAIARAAIDAVRLALARCEDQGRRRAATLATITDAELEGVLRSRR